MDIKKIAKYRKLGWTYAKIGSLFNRTKQAVSDAIKKERKRLDEKDIEKDENDWLKIHPNDYDVRRFKYYCRRCEEEFRSKLPLEDAICVKCGSPKITKI